MAKVSNTTKVEQLQRHCEVRNLLLTARLGLLLRGAPLCGAIVIMVNAGASDAVIPTALDCSAERYWSVLNELTGGSDGEGTESDA